MKLITSTNDFYQCEIESWNISELAIKYLEILRINFYHHHNQYEKVRRPD